MTEHQLLSSKINDGVQSAIALAIERHRIGESIAIWHNDKIVILTADQIPQVPMQYQLSEDKTVS